MLVRNLILMAIPLALIISAAFLSVSHMRKMDDAKVYNMEDLSEAEEFYTLENNAARYETIEEAVALDDRLIAAWAIRFCSFRRQRRN